MSAKNKIKMIIKTSVLMFILSMLLFARPLYGWPPVPDPSCAWCGAKPTRGEPHLPGCRHYIPEQTTPDPVCAYCGVNLEHGEPHRSGCRYYIPEQTTLEAVPEVDDYESSDDFESQREDTREREAFELNEKGVQAYWTGNWEEAIYYFQKALRKSPNDRVIRQNLTNAQNALSNERKEQLARARAKFEQGKKELLAQLKGGSRGRLALKPGSVPADQAVAKVIKDLHNSVYWSLKAVNAVLDDNYEAAREYSGHAFGEHSERWYPGDDIKLLSVLEMPPPVLANPQIKLHSILIKEVNRTTFELKGVKTRLKQAEEKKRKSEEKIEVQKTRIEELEQKKYEREQALLEDEEDRLLAEEQQALLDKAEEEDRLLVEAHALFDEAEKEDKEAAKEIESLNEQQKKHEENLSGLQQIFDTAEKHPEHVENILKELKGDKQ